MHRSQPHFYHLRFFVDCNEKSIWVASCGVPTDPPVSAAPTTIWPSSSPSLSVSPTMTWSDSPSDSPSTPLPTQGPTKKSELVYYLNTNPPTVWSEPTTPPPTNRPTRDDVPSTASPTFGNADDREFAPGDPAGSFFCVSFQCTGQFPSAVQAGPHLA